MSKHRRPGELANDPMGIEESDLYLMQPEAPRGGGAGGS